MNYYIYVFQNIHSDRLFSLHFDSFPQNLQRFQVILEHVRVGERQSNNSSKLFILLPLSLSLISLLPHFMQINSFFGEHESGHKLLFAALFEF